MKNIEKYYNELNSSCLNPNCHWKKKIRNQECVGIPCQECGSDFLQWLNQEYKEPIKLTQFEYDMLSTTSKYHLWLGELKNGLYYIKMKEKGYFKNVDLSMTAKEVLENCEVVENVD